MFSDSKTAKDTENEGIGYVIPAKAGMTEKEMGTFYFFAGLVPDGFRDARKAVHRPQSQRKNRPQVLNHWRPG
jgi:hypothetical protein